MTWLEAGDGYQIRLTDAGKVLCRNAKGRELNAVPAALRDHAEVVRLRQLAEWLERHAAECLATVDRWMVRSLPVATAAIVAAWADVAWRDALRDLVITADRTIGFLRGASPERGVGVVTLDGDTRWANPPSVRVPHPVLLADLDELREFGAELGVEQRVAQLLRQTFARPPEIAAGAHSVREFAGGHFAHLNQAVGRSRTLGYPVRGGNAVCAVFEDGRTVEARYWIGDEDPAYETDTGDLTWSRPDGRTVPLADLGPVAWSEGMRMASTIHAGRDSGERA